MGKGAGRPGDERRCGVLTRAGGHDGGANDGRAQWHDPRPPRNSEALAVRTRCAFLAHRRRSLPTARSRQQSAKPYLQQSRIALHRMARGAGRIPERTLAGRVPERGTLTAYARRPAGGSNRRAMRLRSSPTKAAMQLLLEPASNRLRPTNARHDTTMCVHVVVGIYCNDDPHRAHEEGVEQRNGRALWGEEANATLARGGNGAQGEKRHNLGHRAGNEEQRKTKEGSPKWHDDKSGTSGLCWGSPKARPHRKWNACNQQCQARMREQWGGGIGGGGRRAGHMRGDDRRKGMRALRTGEVWPHSELAARCMAVFALGCALAAHKGRAKFKVK